MKPTSANLGLSYLGTASLLRPRRNELLRFDILPPCFMPMSTLVRIGYWVASDDRAAPNTSLLVARSHNVLPENSTIATREGEAGIQLAGGCAATSKALWLATPGRAFSSTTSRPQARAASHPCYAVVTVTRPWCAGLSGSRRGHVAVSRTTPSKPNLRQSLPAGRALCTAFSCD